MKPQVIPIFEKIKQKDWYPSESLSFCPYCGSEAFEWKGTNYAQCSRCEKRLYMNAAAATLAIIEDGKGNILCTKRAFDPGKGLLDLPGGFADLGETLEEALTRELKEELGWDVRKMTYFCSRPNLYPYRGMIYYTMDTAFIVEANVEQSLVNEDEILSSGFVPVSEINPKDFAFDSIRDIFLLYRQTYHSSR